MAAQEDPSGVRKSGSESAAAAAARVVAATNNSTQQQQQRRSSSATSRVSRPSTLKNASGSGSVAISSALPPRVPPLINDDDDDDEEAAFAGFPALEVELARSGEMIAAAIDNVARFVYEHDVREFINNELDRESDTGRPCARVCNPRSRCRYSVCQSIVLITTKCAGRFESCTKLPNLKMLIEQ
ncbi:hypothetical protein TKK_0014932 [Trichogramma kaykai]|uniref:Uncharacterized protein n=1 Tax=Trichogramma kaykai TaxID=54128 RepID=A0ABD2WD73_9HYME